VIAVKILSGGQSGVDRAALDVALAGHVAYGGWCPKGGWAEDYPEPPGLLVKYPKLKETPLADPAQRTQWNIRDADACLMLAATGGVEISSGTALAREVAAQFRKPLHVGDLRQQDALRHAGEWLDAQRDAFGAYLHLCIGGPRESETPGIYDDAVRFLTSLLR
jgi:Circularly permutated YpsA SLOG family